MESHIVHSYDAELEGLAGYISEMGELVVEMLALAGTALNERTEDLADLAQLTDKKINALDEKIEKKATRLLALRQPMAIDLRMAVSALKIAVIMERMGDLAKKAAKRAPYIKCDVSEDKMARIQDMIRVVSEMMKESLDAFKTHDNIRMDAVCLKDAEVDKNYHELKKELQDQMVSHPEDVPSLMLIIFAIRNIERIGDYVTKVSKIFYYIATGERVSKHAVKTISD